MRVNAKTFGRFWVLIAVSDGQQKTPKQTMRDNDQFFKS